MVVSMRRRIKERMAEMLAAWWEGRDSCLFVDVDRISANDMHLFRTRLRQRKIEMMVVKNAVMKMALDRSGRELPEDFLRKSTGVLVGGADPVAVCRAVVEWRKEEGFPAIKGAVLFGEVLDEAGVEKMAKLPSRREMMAVVAGLLVSGLSGFLGLLQTRFARLLACMEEHVKKLEEAES